MATTRRMSARKARAATVRKVEATQQPKSSKVGQKRHALKDISNADAEAPRLRKKPRTNLVENACSDPKEQPIVAKRPPPRRRSLRLLQPLFKRPDNYLTAVDSYQYTGKVIDIEEEALFSNELREEIHSSLRDQEGILLARPYTQPMLSDSYRAKIVDWIIAVHWAFHLEPETLYLSINIMDRFFERKQVTSRSEAQLAALSSLLIAGKYEEVVSESLRVDDVVDIANFKFTSREVLDMECAILKILEYKVTTPSNHAFLIRFMRAAHADGMTGWLAHMILESTLLSTALCTDFLPSQLASAAVAIARFSVGKKRWSPTLVKYTWYSEEEVLPVASAVLKAFSELGRSKTYLTKKYSLVKPFCRVAKIPLALF